MKKRLPTLIGAIILSMTLLPVAVAEDTGTVLYEHDFEDGIIDFSNNIPDSDGTGEIVEEDGNKFLKLTTHTGEGENGYLHFWGPFAKDGETLTLDMKGDWDYTLRVRPDYIKNPDHNWIKICFNAQDGVWENACYMFEMWQWRGKIAIKDQSTGLDDLNNPLVEGMENETREFYDGDWYNLKISRRGDTFSVYVDGQLNVYMTDADRHFDGGTIVFCSWGANYSVDDLKVVGYEGEGPDPTPDPAATEKPNTTDTTKPDRTDVQTGSQTAPNGEESSFVFPWIPVVIAATAVILVGGGIIVALAAKRKEG